LKNWLESELCHLAKISHLGNNTIQEIIYKVKKEILGITSPSWGRRGKTASRLRDQICQRWNHFSSGNPVM
jgi:hypothetical protein